MKKDVKRTIIDFFEEKGLYDILGSKPLNYSDVLDLEPSILSSLDFEYAENQSEYVQDLEIENSDLEERVEELENRIWRIQSEAESCADKLREVVDELNVDDFDKEEIMSKLEDVKDELYDLGD